MRFWQRLRYIEREGEAALLLGLTFALQQTHSRVTPLAGKAQASEVPPNKRMQPTHQPVIEFAYANLPPVWRTADAWC